MEKNNTLLGVVILAVAGVAVFYIWNQNRLQNAVINATQPGLTQAASGLGSGLASLFGGVGSGIGNLFSGGSSSGGGSTTYYSTSSDDSGSGDYSDDSGDDFMG
ncbi:MAG: hypothetical protein ABSH16_03375 [Sedimentisphaerales bacterium]|jgi:hypothetical protein